MKLTHLCRAERYLWTSEWDKLCLLSEWEWGYSYPNGSVNETLVEWTEGLTEGKDCVKEWTWGVKTDWMLFMISEETARRKEPKVNDWEWSELLLCKEERTNGVTEGEIHLKESELPNEQMDWRLKHNLCVFIWRTEGAIPLGSWNEVKRSDCSWMRPHTKIHSVWSNELSERNK